MSQYNQDPWQDVENTAEPFSLSYKKGTGEPVVYGSLLLGAALLGTGIISASPIPVLASLPVFLSVYWHYPFIDKRPQLAASDEGLYLERLGVVRWSAIAELSIYTTAVRTMEFAQLHIRLKGSLDECITKREPQSLVRSAMRKNWRLKQKNTNQPLLEVDLHLLPCSPELLIKRIKQFWRLN